jgi:hypothetical protein
LLPLVPFNMHQSILSLHMKHSRCSHPWAPVLIPWYVYLHLLVISSSKTSAC